MMATTDTDIEMEIGVKGMACEGCVENVAKAVRTVPGVTEAHVDLGTASVRVKGRPGALDRQRVIDAIRAAGYEAS